MYKLIMELMQAIELKTCIALFVLPLHTIVLTSVVVIADFFIILRRFYNYYIQPLFKEAYFSKETLFKILLLIVPQFIMYSAIHALGLWYIMIGLALERGSMTHYVFVTLLGTYPF
jgi:hypothetical protein